MREEVIGLVLGREVDGARILSFKELVLKTYHV